MIGGHIPGVVDTNLQYFFQYFFYPSDLEDDTIYADSVVDERVDDQGVAVDDFEKGMP
jgi:hypothetical protein